MPDLTMFALFAQQRNFNLTGALSSQRVELLLNAWLPEARFYEEELFHPISLDRIMREPRRQFDLEEESVKAQLRLSVGGELVPPPAIYIKDDEAGGKRALNPDQEIDNALENLDLDASGVLTHKADFDRSNRYFGATESISGGASGVPGDPMRPRFPVEVGGECRMLLEVLKAEIQIAKAGAFPKRVDGLPLDAVMGEFAILHLLFFQVGKEEEVEDFTLASQQDVALLLIEAYENDDDEAFQTVIDNDIPAGWLLNRATWNALIKYAFLEYNFNYAYNDYHRYGDWPWVNQHEFDNEGCALVFERRLWEEAVESDNPQAALLDVDPVAIITSVHEEWQGADKFKLLSPDIARDDLTVWIAAGSHATYLQPGDHDLFNAGDVAFGLPGQKVPIPILAALYVLSPTIATLALLAVIAEHFQDAEDKTSDDGVIIGSQRSSEDQEDRLVGARVDVTPLSADRNIYDNALRAQLRVRSFGGRWGDHDGSVNHSPHYINKTGRYFRRLMTEIRKGNVDPTPVA